MVKYRTTWKLHTCTLVSIRGIGIIFVRLNQNRKIKEGIPQADSM